MPAAVTRKMLRKATEADTQLQMLKEDIMEGKCRNSLHRYSQIFAELAVVDGLVVRGEQDGNRTTEAHRASHGTLEGVALFWHNSAPR